MNHDEPKFENKLEKYSLVKRCPKCSKLSLSFKSGSIYCSNCGYEEQVPILR